MTIQTDSNQLQSADTRKLSNFIHELNISRRHLLTYPAGHPMIDQAFEKVLAQLDPLFAAYGNISLGVAKDAILFERQWLDKSNPSFRDFAGALAQLDIAAVHFRSKPNKSELLKLADLINTDRQKIAAQGGLTEYLQQLQLTRIDITPVDYAAFQTTELDPQEQEQLAKTLWTDFLAGLMNDTLVRETGETNLANLNPKEIAKLLNRSYALTEGDSPPAHDQAIANFIGRLRLTKNTGQGIGQQFQQLVEQLNPELRRQFLNSTFRHVADDPVASESTLQALPSSFIELAMQELKQNQLNVSSTMINLLGELSRHHSATKDQVTSGKTEEPDSIGEKLKTLFREEQSAKFTPASYQTTLDDIVLQDHEFKLERQETEQLRQQLRDSSTERHSCAIIFNLLDKQQLLPEQCDGMQSNLVDLAQYFLETGDFKGLSYLHQRLGRFLKQHPKTAAERTERLQQRLNAAEFHQEVLDNLSRWDEQKQQEINAYIKLAGASIAESLIERLATEEDKSLRRVYLTTLASLGKAAHAAIYAALDDERWFLVRNLVTALRMQNDPIDLTIIQQLEQHQHARINQEMLQLLFKFDRDRANDLLSRQLESNDPQICLHAVQLAEQSRDPAIVQKLLTLLAAEKLSNETLPLKKQIIKTLNGIGSEEALPALQKLLKPGLLFTSKRKLDLQQEIIRHLDKYPVRKVSPLLQKLVRSRHGQLNNLAAEKLRQLLRKQS